MIKLATYERSVRKNVTKKYANTMRYITVAITAAAVAIDYTKSLILFDLHTVG